MAVPLVAVSRVGAEADQAPGRHPELQPHPAGAVVDHLGHPPPAQGQALGDHADELLGHVEGDRLVRLLDPPVDGAGDDLGPRHLQLVALAPGLLDQHGQLELAPALDLEGVGRGGGHDPDGHVAEHLAVQPLGEVAAGQVGAVVAGERRGVDPEPHRDAGLVDRDHRQGPRVVGVGDGLADGHVAQPGDGHDLPRPGVVQVGAGQPDGPGDLGHLGQGQAAVALGHPDPVAEPDLALPQPPHGQAADVRVGVQVGDQELERVPGLVGRRRGGGDDRLQQRGQVAGQVVRAGARPARRGRWRTGWGSRSGARRRPGPGTAPRPRGRPRPGGRRPGRPC